MEISTFKIRQAVFEIRYEPAYLLWDRAGMTTEAIRKVWPGLRVREAAPNQQILENDDVVVLTGIQTSYVALVQPRNLVYLSSQIEATLKIWVEMLNIDKFARVGTRVIYSKVYASREEVKSAISGIKLVNAPIAPFFNHNSPPSLAEIKLVWEDSGSMTQVSIRPEHSDIEIKAGPDTSIKSQKESTDSMIIDIDRAAKGSVEISKFRVSSWLEGVQHLIARDMKRILGEG